MARRSMLARTVAEIARERVTGVDVGFLPGQISWCPLEETIEGTIVFDGAVWPPKELGLLHSPIRLILERGG